MFAPSKKLALTSHFRKIGKVTFTEKLEILKDKGQFLHNNYHYLGALLPWQYLYHKNDNYKININVLASLLVNFAKKWLQKQYSGSQTLERHQ